MTARSIFAAPSTICARCDGEMTVTHDAIGRERYRCPVCDRVAPPRPRHPDDAMVPQGLVRVGALPLVAPGQLRCQRCAKGVDGDARFCGPCTVARLSEGRRGAVYHPKPCRNCTLVFTPSGPRSEYCEACR